MTEMAGESLTAITSEDVLKKAFSPLLWYLVVDALVARLNRLKIYTQAYADDSAILEFS